VVLERGGGLIAEELTKKFVAFYCNPYSSKNNGSWAEYVAVDAS